MPELPPPPPSPSTRAAGVVPAAGPAVSATGLTKRYEGFTAVDGVDFATAPGTCFGFLGPNGAGKTTTMRMICGRSPLSGGTLSVLGLDVRTRMRAIKARIGIVSQDDNLDTDFSARDNLIVYAGYFDIPRAEAAVRADELLAFAGLSAKAGVRVEKLSGGQQRRLCIVRALVNRPELVVLDEPTTGLDPQARHLVWGRLRELRRQGVTLLLTTHYMEEAAQLCDRLVVMDHGRILAEGDPAALVAAHAGGGVLEVEPPGPPRDFQDYPALVAAAARTEVAGDTLLAYTADLASAEALAARIPHRAYRVRASTLEDVFLRLTGRQLGGAADEREQEGGPDGEDGDGAVDRTATVGPPPAGDASGAVAPAVPPMAVSGGAATPAAPAAPRGTIAIAQPPLLDIGYRVAHVWRRHMRVWVRYWLSTLLTNFVEPFVYLVGIGFGLGVYVHRIGGIPYATFVAPGIIASSAMFAASFENTFGTYVRLTYEKTFDAVIATPVSADEVSAADLIYGATKSTLFAAVITLAILVTHLVPAWRWTALLVPPVALLTGLIFGALGMMVAALVPNIDNFNYYITLVLTPMFVFAGVFYPVATLPAFARTIAWFTPLAHAVNLCRGLVLGPASPGLWGDALWLLVAAAIVIPWPIRLMRRRLIQ